MQVVCCYEWSAQINNTNVCADEIGPSKLSHADHVRFFIVQLLSLLFAPFSIVLVTNVNILSRCLREDRAWRPFAVACLLVLEIIVDSIVYYNYVRINLPEVYATIDFNVEIITQCLSYGLYLMYDFRKSSPQTLCLFYFLLFAEAVTVFVLNGPLHSGVLSNVLAPLMRGFNIKLGLIYYSNVKDPSRTLKVYVIWVIVQNIIGLLSEIVEPCVILYDNRRGLPLFEAETVAGLLVSLTMLVQFVLLVLVYVNYIRDKIRAMQCRQQKLDRSTRDAVSPLLQNVAGSDKNDESLSHSSRAIND